ncbi:hypothetical protein L202_02460 [Cryptococcus amylolentus CBS 6039]|uniref:Transmembrane protein n=2 Tax=Cryptococcus amylolentus TaxID=104669 RepID=A0A1E3I2I6_9TREE|nr:hypothetical protein L202_02460 [Cryptococcus amylolentus CBS 6039]ODN82166.1 hypothetical protein L202_02460 [Cryptococcus amylolentus CBS 6039]ODO09740.1 hypothetical protein I350_01957 [Cryptococcus amylolentus CBS 6273]
MPDPSLGSGPRIPSRKGPNPLFFLGMVVASSLAFFGLAEKRQQDNEAKGIRPVNTSSSLFMRSGKEGEKIDMPNPRRVE